MRKTLHPLGWGLLGAGLAVVTSAGALHLPWADSKPARADSAATASLTPVAAAAAATASPGATPNYRAIVQQSGPSVVGITVEGRRQADDAQPMGLPPGWRLVPPGGAQGFTGQGSGFIIDADGLVLTNAHVVKDAQTVTVRLADRREFQAQVLGSDAATDIAVLRIPAKGLPAVRLGNPAQLEVGDPVLAIGAPYGLQQTATAGIVSATGRSLPGDGAVPFIQTDAAVNPGNSGGPLFDATGSVVGVNAQIYSRTGGYQGLSFAIPVDVAMRVARQIVATGSAQHARLGVAVQDMTQALADSFGLKRPDGALVSQVAPDGAAAKAGLQAGDVVLAIDGQPVPQAGALSARVAQATPGERVALTVWRDGSERRIELALGRAEASAATQAADAGPEAGAGGPRLGLALRPLQPQERAQAKLAHGLLVQQAQGPAARAGLQQGDVVLAINGQPLDDLATLKKVLAAQPKKVALLVWRDGQQLFVPVAPA